MYCPKCGTQHPDDANFCLKCGKAFGNPIDSIPIERNPNLDRLESKHRRDEARDSTYKSFIFFLAICLAAFLTYKFIENEEAVSNFAEEAISELTAGSQGYTSIITGDFYIEPEEYRYYPFTIPEEWGVVRVTGSFSSSGGGGNDVSVHITDYNGFLNFHNGHALKGWYHSGKVTADSLDVSLGPGDYYLIFSNVFSLVSAKTVSSSIGIEYTE